MAPGARENNDCSMDRIQHHFQPQLQTRSIQTAGESKEADEQKQGEDGSCPISELSVPQKFPATHGQ